MTYTIIGFTGTRKGLSWWQNVKVHGQLKGWKANGAEFFMHGMCVGADEIAHHLAFGLGYKCVGLPSNRFNKVAKLDLGELYQTYSPAEPLARNKLIVEQCHLLLACPETTQEEQRSGTWMTIRYARKLRRPLILIMPTGELRYEIVRQEKKGMV
jgi:hypothetical protein